jgi:hypothetical protein
LELGALPGCHLNCPTKRGSLAAQLKRRLHRLRSAAILITTVADRRAALNSPVGSKITWLAEALPELGNKRWQQ